jgi:menaquinone-dependent protoporphyrinogen oxidase
MKTRRDELGGIRMSDKILVAYATAAGSTGEVAEAIGKTLIDQGMAVEVRPAKEVADLEGYRAVVVGTGIRAGQVYRQALSFLRRHDGSLAQVPVALFVVCLTMQEDTEETRRTVGEYVQQMRDAAPNVEPVDVGLFAGRMDYSKVPLVLRLIVKAMKIPEGDHRDWEKIRTWATKLGSTLRA